MKGTKPAPGVKGGETPTAFVKAISPARTAAFEVLMLVAMGRGHSDELLHSSRLDGLSTADKSLAMALVMGVLRWQIALDARLRSFLSRPDMRVADEVLVAMRMGAFQLLHMDRIPAHAALSESVELCRWAGQPHAAGMVNAVLRRLLREPAPGVPIWETTIAFAERLGHPAWIAERWVATYDREAALRMCEAGQREPAEGAMFCEETQVFAAGEGATAPGETWDPADAELGFTPASTAGDPVDRMTPRNAHPLPVMDDGSRLVAELAAAVLPETPGRRARVWDCCAAPGGKTMVLARRLVDQAEVLATDISARRMAAMRARLEAAGYGKVRCATYDAADLPEAEGSFDLVLCDVPCTGTGTLARNPEIRHRLRPEELGRQAERQRALLRAAFQRLAPGGRLVYSTCSLEPEEGERVVDAVVATENARRIDIAPALDQLVASGIVREGALVGSMIRSGALRTLPGVHACDGFFAAVLERREDAPTEV